MKRFISFLLSNFMLLSMSVTVFAADKITVKEDENITVAKSVITEEEQEKLSELPVEIKAKSAVLMEVTSGKVLMEYNADKKNISEIYYNLSNEFQSNSEIINYVLNNSNKEEIPKIFYKLIMLNKEEEFLELGLKKNPEILKNFDKVSIMNFLFDNETIFSPKISTPFFCV